MCDSLVLRGPWGVNGLSLSGAVGSVAGLLAGETEGFPTSSVIALTTRMVPQRDQHSH